MTRLADIDGDLSASADVLVPRMPQHPGPASQFIGFCQATEIGRRVSAVVTAPPGVERRK